VERCVIRVGRIIDHACGRLAAGRCKKCANDACSRHLAAGVCAVCDGSWRPPVASLRLEDLDLDEHFAGGVDEAFGERAGGRNDLHGLDS
jgi:hypothetical protein